ncbi:hypothetical protein [Streptomyces sp. CA-253872]|uniref:hypothetical protein n=1 Tax=Streptomyces sp. CA-253872 TaxID=3240067 RepID=UPI003D8A9C0F
MVVGMGQRHPGPYDTSPLTIDEACFIFLQTYIVLGEILTLSAPADGDSWFRLPAT